MQQQRRGYLNQAVRASSIRLKLSATLFHQKQKDCAPVSSCDSDSAPLTSPQNARTIELEVLKRASEDAVNTCTSLQAEKDKLERRWEDEKIRFWSSCHIMDGMILELEALGPVLSRVQREMEPWLLLNFEELEAVTDEEGTAEEEIHGKVKDGIIGEDASKKKKNLVDDAMRAVNEEEEKEGEGEEAEAEENEEERVVNTSSLFVADGKPSWEFEKKLLWMGNAAHGGEKLTGMEKFMRMQMRKSRRRDDNDDGSLCGGQSLRGLGKLVDCE